MIKFVAVALAVLLAGCNAAPKVRTEIVKVAVPVECKEAEPDRPEMPTESLLPGVSLDDFAKSAMAEIDRREGYEVLLRAALSACKTPVVEP